MEWENLIDLQATNLIMALVACVSGVIKKDIYH